MPYYACISSSSFVTCTAVAYHSSTGDWTKMFFTFNCVTDRDTPSWLYTVTLAQNTYCFLWLIKIYLFQAAIVFITVLLHVSLSWYLCTSHLQQRHFTVAMQNWRVENIWLCPAGTIFWKSSISWELYATLIGGPFINIAASTNFNSSLPSELPNCYRSWFNKVSEIILRIVCPHWHYFVIWQLPI